MAAPSVAADPVPDKEKWQLFSFAVVRQMVSLFSC